ncbi:MAG: sensor histidine kinase [Anaerolineales bacterium]|nr:sensor histidine kinase [Anaerolineales bacterium]
MNYYFTAVSLVAGICLGFGILYLFIGLRRKDNKPLYLTFALFALCYSATLFNGIRWYSTTNVPEHIAINRVDSIFVVGAFVGLIWYVSYYTDYRPRIFLWLLSSAFLLTSLVFVISPAAFIGKVSGLINIALPWGEQLANLDSSGSIWLDINLLARLVTLGYIVFALIIQYRRGEHQPAVILGFGILPFITGIFYEVLGESGFVPYIPLGEFGFLGIAIAASLQMANSAIKSDEALDQYRNNLEGLVEERTAELEVIQKQLLTQAREKAVTAERSRLARDLHDAVTQTIYSASLIAEVLPTVWERSPTEGQRNLVKLRQLVRGALAEMRSLLFELRPDSLEAAGLSTLLRHLGDALTGRTRIPVNFQIGEDFSPPTEVKVAIYRIAQEAFNNIAKHSDATQVEVELRSKLNQVTLSVQDNGRGYDHTKVAEDKMGHQIMSERAQEINAKFELNSSPGKGTLVSIFWPDRE